MSQFKQQGFTLLELMIALALGLVIVAAAVTLFITGQRSYTVQQGMSENQNNANFGLNIVTKDIRHANLDGSRLGVSDRSILGGIVLTSKANPYIDTTNANAEIANLPITIPITQAPLVLLSRGNGQTASTTANQWSGETNVVPATGAGTLQSDQLVIQYRPVEIGGFDCEGNEITSRDQMVIQRYFLRVDTNAATSEPNKALALACDAGRYNLSAGTNAFINYGDAGQIIMPRVDHFRVLLGVETGTGAALRRRFVDVTTYFQFPSNATVARPKIFAVQIGVLSRSVQSVGDDGVISATQEYKILDQTVKVKTPTGTPPKYVRQVVTQTIALRNAMGG